ncbi:MAG: hypothetical protein ACRDWD_17615 [Acidimicrobiia bacterium]
MTAAADVTGSAGDQLLDTARAAFTSGLRLAIMVGAVILVAAAAATLVLLPHERGVRRRHWAGALGRPHHDPAPLLVGGKS